MIVSRAPVSITLAGGAAVVPALFQASPGLAISAAINRYAQAQAIKPLDGGVRLASANLRARASYRRGHHPAVSGRLAYLAAVVEHFWDAGIREQGIDLKVRCDVAPGSGLGSSSAVLVALVGVVSKYCGQDLGQVEIADLAGRLEGERLRKSESRQDAYASAFGGLNAISLGRRGVEVDRLRVPGGGLQELGRWLMLFDATATREPVDPFSPRSGAARHGSRSQAAPDQLRDLATRVLAELEQGNLHAFGSLLDEVWALERGHIDDISSSPLDQAYATARASGALGGKLCGDGYLLLCCPPAERHYLRAMMGRHGLEELSFVIDAYGVRTSVTASTADRRAGTRAAHRRR